METISKSPQELAAQVMDSYPIYGSFSMPKEDADRLEQQAKDYKSAVHALEPATMNDAELQNELDMMEEEARASGVYTPTEGQGSDERLKFNTEKFKGFGFNDEMALSKATSDLDRFGYVRAVRFDRQEKERLFTEPINKFIDETPITPEVENEQIEELLSRTIDIDTMTPEEQHQIAEAFPSGNFVFHSSTSGRLLKILCSGELVHAKKLFDEEENAAEKEGRNKETVSHNSGYEGISWSMNEIDALPGDRFHIAGFVVAPETALSDETQFTVPSRPAPNEVIQIPSGIDAKKYYDAKTQFELYREASVFGEANSVHNNLMAISFWEDTTTREFSEEPLLLQAMDGLFKQPDFQEQLRSMYHVNEAGKIELSPDLFKQTKNIIPVAAVWIQAAIDNNKLTGTSFENKDIISIIKSLNSENIAEIIRIAIDDSKFYEKIIDDEDEKSTDVGVPVEKMYFVAPRKDAKKWIQVIARSGHKPAGIILYDGKKVRLENFASDHRGDHGQLSQELHKAIVPAKGYIKYGEVLGQDFNDEMRSGAKHHIIAEKYLTDRKTIKKVGGKLVVGE